MRRARRVLVSLTVAGLTAALVGGQTASAAPAPAGAPAVGADLQLVQVRDSLLARHYSYEQVYRGVPVLGGFYLQHVAEDGTLRVDDGRIELRGQPSVVAAVEQTAAERTALARLGGTLAGTRLAISPDSPPRLVWAVQNTDSLRALVDARTGAIVRVESLIKQVTGSGRVFDPNPVVALQNQDLVDSGDADSAVPAAAYRTVRLRNLDGSGYLRGSYATIQLPANKLAFSAANTFQYTRSNDFFEQVESYYSVDRA